MSEHHEHQATAHALDAIANWMRPGTNEGVTFSMCRLTLDLFTDSFEAGGDISLFTPTAHRGTLRSQESTGYILDSGGAVPHGFPLQLTFDLDTATVTAQWTNPVTSQSASTTVVVELKSPSSPEGPYTFNGDVTSDDAGYVLTFLLL